MNTTFGIIGGDKRQLYLAHSIMNDGYQVYICGFEMSSETTGLAELSLAGLINTCDNIILPLPVTRDSGTIFAPYSAEEIVVCDDFILSLMNKNVYGGFMSRLVTQNDLWCGVNVGDYFLREELAISNAIATAEGAVGIAVSECPGILCGTKCLVTGYGRIGKILTKDLLGLGASVHVAARKSSDLALIRGSGAVPVKYSEILGDYAIIFNTVPDMVLTSEILTRLSVETTIIELASLPGGVDRRAATLRGIRIIDGQSLPGKVSPKASGEFIKDAIYNMMEEQS